MLISLFASPNGITVQVRLKSIHPFRGQRADKAFFNILGTPVTLKIEVKVTKI